MAQIVETGKKAQQSLRPAAVDCLDGLILSRCITINSLSHFAVLVSVLWAGSRKVNN